MQFLRRVSAIKCQRQLFGKSIRFSSAKVISIPYGSFQHAAFKGKRIATCQSCYHLLSTPRMWTCTPSSERAVLVLRYQSKVSQANVDRSASISLRSLLTLNGIGKRGKQGREVQRLVDLAKPEWKKLGGMLIVLLSHGCGTKGFRIKQSNSCTQWRFMLYALSFFLPYFAYLDYIHYHILH